MKTGIKPPPRMIWKIFCSHLTIILLSLLAATLFISISIRRFHVANLKEELARQAAAMELQIMPGFAAGDWEAVNRLAGQLSRTTATRITVIRADGEVVGESSRDRDDMEIHLHRPEIQMVLRQNRGYARRYSTSLRKNMLYVAVPLNLDGEVDGFMRLARPLTGIRETLNQIYKPIIAVGLTASVIAAIFSLAVAKRLTEPLEYICRGAARLADGDLNTRLYLDDSRELNSVAKAINRMATRLSSLLNHERREKAEAVAIADSMIEGVIAVDLEERIININRAAKTMLNLPSEYSQGDFFQKAIRVPGLQIMAAQTALSDRVLVREIMVYGKPGERRLQVHATRLKPAPEEEPYGVLLVLHDITHIRRLENLRQQFVANVSHELRTPITAVRGAIETILDAAIDNREDCERFLRIALHHTLRLNRLIGDLLLLSRLDQTAENELQMSDVNLRKLLYSAVENTKANPDWANRTITVDCPGEITISANISLFEQAIINLLNNAVSYSPPETGIRVEAEQYNKQVTTIKVIDRGIGIEKKHRERIFERFYRADQARSREGGGTGLGLAIVKHIVQLHAGTVELDSELGKGSVFTVKIGL